MSKAKLSKTSTTAAQLKDGQVSERLKDPPVWLDMDQKELDDAYDQSVWAPNQEYVKKRRQLWCERTRARVGAPPNV